MLITVRSFPTTQRLHRFKFTLVNKSLLQHSEAAVRCLGRHFLILYACAHEVSFPDQRPLSSVWKRDSTQAKWPAVVRMAGTVFPKVYPIGRLSFHPIPCGTALFGHVTSGDSCTACSQVGSGIRAIESLSLTFFKFASCLYVDLG